MNNINALPTEDHAIHEKIEEVFQMLATRKPSREVSLAYTHLEIAQVFVMKDSAKVQFTKEEDERVKKEELNNQKVIPFARDLIKGE